ncbi:restriction endonuclease [Xylanibacter ruminicola]|uniref:Restriction system protein n=1 Tax=Xylanibacter ruminicola TaxID=839 RepID=A0A1M6W4Y3_XYLRU|nr:restriction endonuclease [Xylanibacter ruminicola]SHK88783.1 restriction system protein [Xylanibacter ruminicola]
MKAKSKSYVTSAKTMYAAMTILKKNGGSMPIRILMQEVEKNIELSAWEKSILESTGNIRWQSIMHFTSVDYVRAGFLIKKKGNWTITPEGEDALKMGAEKLRDEAGERYKVWYRGKEQAPGEKPIVQPEEENDPAKETMIELETLEERAANGIREYLKSKNPYEFQDLVASLLKAMGYYIQAVAPRGKDGGIDIVAYTDPLGAKTPRIKVQVKHKPDTATGAADVRALLGILKAGDIALFVTSGTYSTDAKHAATSGDKFIRLIDGDEFIQMWQEYYDKMSDEDKNMLPLKRIAFLGNNE